MKMVCVEPGLPTGPPRIDWNGKGLRQAPVPGGQHDCFSTAEILRLATRSSLSYDNELHLLGGLASGCLACWRAIDRAQSDLTFQVARSPGIELLRVLTLYPLQALPLPLRHAAESAKGGGTAAILALLVESTAYLYWDAPRLLLEELDDIRSLSSGSIVEGWKALGARIDTYSARAWRRVEDVPQEERQRRAGVILEMALLQARASGDVELVASALAARAELTPSRRRQCLNEAAQILPNGNPMRAELLCELAVSATNLTAALETILQAVAETEALEDSYPGLRISLLHHTAVLAARAAWQERDQPPSFGLHVSLASVAHAQCKKRQCKKRLRAFPLTDEALRKESRILGQHLVHPELEHDEQKKEQARLESRAYELFHDPKALPARVRAESHQLVRALAEQDYEDAALEVWQDSENPEECWTPVRFQQAMAPFHEEYGKLVFNHRARRSQHSRLVSTGFRTWDVTQVLVDSAGDHLWFIEATIDLSDAQNFEGPLLRMRRIGT